MNSNTPDATHGAFDVIVITSAALPWLTGPSYLSLGHACGLSALGYRVLYVIPWLAAGSQHKLWGEVRFASFADQSRWIRREAERAGHTAFPVLKHYKGIYSNLLRSIVPAHSVFRELPRAQAIILEEPEHLCWPISLKRRKDIDAGHVAGFAMTNYAWYVAESGRPGARKLAKLVDAYHRWLVKRHTDQVLAISPAIDFGGIDHPLKVARVTGVLDAYFHVPRVTAEIRGVFFLGKLIWEKGLAEVVEFARRSGTAVDLIGEGPDQEAIAALARETGAPIRFLGATTSPWELLPAYRVFFNPSRSEGLCSTTAEALVAGRHVIFPDCPANRPFLQYTNAHPYDTLDEALALLETLLTKLPVEPVRVRQDFNWLQACRNLAAHCGIQGGSS